MTTQEVLADFVTKTTIGDIAPLALERGRQAISDCIGVALIGSTTPLAKALRGYLEASGDFGPDGKSLLIGCGERSSPANAALYNATVSHALDFDDDSHPGNAHYSCALVGALIGVFPDKELFGEDFLCAYSIGYEVDGKLGQVLTRHKRGLEWHPTGVLGPVGCAAAVAKAIGLDHAATRNALGIAASCASGIRANFGTMTKPFHAGRAAQAGVMAALLAQEGYDSSADAFDGKTGYFRAFGTVEPEQLIKDLDASFSRIANPWEITTDIGIQLKPYPSCAATNPGIEAALRIGAKVDFHDIESIYIGTCSVASHSMPYHLPDEGLQGKFSIEYCIAAALRWGTVKIATFTDEQVRDPQVRELIGKTTVEIDDRVRDSTEHSTVVSVTTKSGETFEELIEISKGKGARWMTTEDQLEKFEDTAGSFFGADKARQLFELMNASSVSGDEIAPYLMGANS